MKDWKRWLPGAIVSVVLIAAILSVVDIRKMADAIRTMRVRGAPLIGVAAAFGVALDGDGDRAIFVDERGAPIDFETTDRFYADPKDQSKVTRCRWTTPIDGFQHVGDRLLPRADAVQEVSRMAVAAVEAHLVRRDEDVARMQGAVMHAGGGRRVDAFQHAFDRKVDVVHRAECRVVQRV